MTVDTAKACELRMLVMPLQLRHKPALGPLGFFVSQV